MNRTSKLQFLLWSLVTTLLVPSLTAGCTACSNSPLAELVAAQGDVVRDFNEQRETWEPAPVGAEFSLGDAVQTGQAAGAAVRFDDGAVLTLEQATTIRFLSAPEDERGISVETGHAELLTKGRTKLRTGIGLAVIEAGSRVRLSKLAGGLRFSVEVGMARLQQTDGSFTDVAAGESLEIGIGMAILEPVAPPEPSATASAEETPGPPPILAVLQGDGVEVKAPNDDNFRPLPPGKNELKPGSRLKLPRNTSAAVNRGSLRASVEGAGTFLILGDPKELVRPIDGKTKLSADGSDVTMEVPGGTITALGSEEPTDATVEVTPEGRTEVKVIRGQVLAEVGDNEERISAGEGLIVDQERFDITGRGLGFFDISTQAGGSLTIHDPAPPTAVRVNIGELCSNVGILELLRRGKVIASAADKLGPSLPVSKGQTPYRLRCLTADGQLSEPKATGRIAVYQDSGTAPLAKRPPATAVNVDGRSYTVLYQNRLPTITVRWPGAPQASNYTIQMNGRGQARQVSTSLPVHTFRSGSVAEGKHTVQFHASNGRVSRVTTVFIRFDNAAPKANIFSPSPGGVSPGASVHVAGVALPGWKVRVGEQLLGMDSQRRFVGQVTAGPRGLVLRFEHDRRGVHHYIRRAVGVER